MRSAMSHTPQTMRTMRGGRSGGNVYIEYLVIALFVLGATLTFFGGGDFGGSRAKVNEAFNNVCQQLGGAPCEDGSSKGGTTP